MPDKKIEIGQRMLKLRKQMKKSQSEAAEFLGLSVAAYQNYETGRREANYETLCKLADFFCVTTDFLLGREPEKNPIAMLNLAVGEKEALEMYVKLPEQVRQIIIDTMLQLSEAARKGIENNVKQPIFVFKRFSVHKASAGCGYDLNDPDEWQDLCVIDTPEARQADFAVEVEGASMESTYQDRDIVYIVTDPEVPIGKICLFIQNGKGYIKEAGTDYLISHNADFPDIYPKEGEIISIGRVIGKAKLPD